MRLLVIEDSTFQRNHLKRILTEFGFEVLAAPNAELGLDILKKDIFDAVFCDLLMPKMDGFAFLEQLKIQGIKIPVFIVSANIQETVKEKCRQLGAAHFFNKPMTSDQVPTQVIPLLRKLGLAA